MKQKKCKICKAAFTPRTPTQMVCSWVCASIYTQQLAEKRKRQDEANKRKEYREAKEKQKTRADWIKDAQKVFNAYIRARDHGKPCISCGKATKQGDQAGHWKPTSSSPELRFHEDNVHLQCLQCNLHFHGNVAKYREGLLQRIGLDKVEWLEGPHEAKKYSVDDLKELKRIYKEKLKELQK